MVKEISNEKSLTADFEKRIAATMLVKKLFSLRQVKGLSQQEMGAKLGWSQSRVPSLPPASKPPKHYDSNANSPTSSTKPAA